MPLIAPNVIVRDWSLYPRESVDTDHVYVLKEALRAGVEFPPLVVEKTSKKLIDGFHRLAAWEDLHGDSAEIPVAFKTCLDKQAFLLESIKANASHGKLLTHDDRSRCLVLAENLSIDTKAVAAALNLRVDRAKKLTQDALRPDALVKKLPPGKKPPSMTGRGGYNAKENEHLKGADQRTKLMFYAGQLRVALINKVIPVSVHENLLLLYRELSEYLTYNNVSVPTQEGQLERLRLHFEQQGFDKGDINAVLNRLEQRRTFGGAPITDPLAWCTAGIVALAEERKKSPRRAGDPLVITIDGEKFERTPKGGLQPVGVSAS